MTSRRRAARALAGLVLAVASVLAATTEVHAATPTFGRPTIDGSFGGAIVARQPLTFDTAPDLVEVVITTADGPPLVAEVTSPGVGSTTLRYALGGDDGHIPPNTPVRVRWRITTDGAATSVPVPFDTWKRMVSPGRTERRSA